MCGLGEHAQYFQTAVQPRVQTEECQPCEALEHTDAYLECLGSEARCRTAASRSSPMTRRALSVAPRDTKDVPQSAVGSHWAPIRRFKSWASFACKRCVTVPSEEKGSTHSLRKTKSARNLLPARPGKGP